MNALIPLCQLTSLLGLHNKRPCGHLKDAPICPGSTTALGLAQPGPAEQLSTHTPPKQSPGADPRAATVTHPTLPTPPPPPPASGTAPGWAREVRSFQGCLGAAGVLSQKGDAESLLPTPWDVHPSVPCA